MTITEREFQALKDTMDRNHGAIMDMLDLRKEYFDKQFSELCRSIKEMKSHCAHTQDQCLVVFKEHDKRINANSNDIGRIKTVGSVLAFIWGAVVALSGHLLRKM